MAKHLLLNVLEEFLGKFVDGLAGENLKIGVFSGKIEFKNLKLKTSALEDINIDLPVSISKGSLRMLRLIIPWTSLESKPVKILIDGLLLQLKPFDVNKVNQEIIKKSILNAKHKALLHIEETILKNLVVTNKEHNTYMQKLLIKIIDNIEVSISNIHIRYENIINTSNLFYSFGITLESISISTTDNNWKEMFINRDENKGKILNFIFIFIK